MNNSKISYKTVAILVAIVAILAIIGTVAYNLLKSAELSILVAPSTATVKINGKAYTNGQHKFFPKDNVEVEISSPGYQAQTTTIDLLANQVTLLRAALEDEDGGYGSYLHDGDTYGLLQLIAPTIGDSELADFIVKTDKKIGILSILPVNENTGEFFKDQHGFIVSTDPNSAVLQIMASSNDCGVIPCLDIYQSDNDIGKARDYLKKQGYNLDDYEYELGDNYLFEPNYRRVK